MAPANGAKEKAACCNRASQAVEVGFLPVEMLVRCDGEGDEWADGSKQKCAPVCAGIRVAGTPREASAAAPIPCASLWLMRPLGAALAVFQETCPSSSQCL